MYTLEDSTAYKILKTRDADFWVGDIQRVFTMISPLINEICVGFDNYTLHNIDHSLRVLHYMCEIAGDVTLNSLSNLELTMIILSALLHDIGMRVTREETTRIEQNSQFAFYLKKNKGNKKLAIQDFVRPIHGRRSYDFIMQDEKIKTLLHDNRLTAVSYYEDVAIICQSHMESLEWINANLKESFSKGDHFNSKYIALLLRIADYIDFDSQRAPQYLFEHKMLNVISQTEWEKHANVCNFEKIDKNTEEIYFDISCSDFHLYTQLMDTIEAMNNEVSGCVKFSKQFSNSKYHLKIKEAIRIRVDTLGFSAKRFSFIMDYYSVTQLLMGENLYGDKKLGFRELLQNSIDACYVMKEYYLSNDPTTSYTPEVDIIYDYDELKVIIKDNGIGMSKEIISKYFLTIGKSYYRSDEYEKLGYKTNPTGTFGIGFLSCFMLSDEVSVNTKHYASGEITSFLLEKNSKYICHLEDTFLGPHGTAISLSMVEFERIFSKKALLSFIDKNFYDLGVDVKIYSKREGVLSYEESAVSLSMTRQLNIDLSRYLKGVECKASIATVLDEFKLYSKYPEGLGEVSNAVLISQNDVQIVQLNSIYDHLDKRCVVLESTSAFEELLTQTFGDREIIGNYGFDLDELVDFFERYGFDIFDPDFDLYKAHEKNGWWIGNVDTLFLKVCVFIDPSLSDEEIKDILHRTRIRYLLDLEGLSIDWGGGYIACSSRIVEGYEKDDLFIENQKGPGYYGTAVCYRGVLLGDAHLKLPLVATIMTDIRVATNILRGDFIPSVTRSDLTSVQRQMLSYAVGKAIHRYLIELFSDDEEISEAIRKLIAKEYYEDNILCN